MYLSEYINLTINIGRENEQTNKCGIVLYVRRLELNARYILVSYKLVWNDLQRFKFEGEFLFCATEGGCWLCVFRGTLELKHASSKVSYKLMYIHS